MGSGSEWCFHGRRLDIAVSYPDKVLGKGNYIVAKVNGVKMTLTSVELQQLMDNGYDVEVTSS